MSLYQPKHTTSHTTSWDVVNCHMVAIKTGGKTAAPVMLCVLQVPKMEARLAPKFKHALPPHNHEFRADFFLWRSLHCVALAGCRLRRS